MTHKLFDRLCLFAPLTLALPFSLLIFLPTQQLQTAGMFILGLMGLLWFPYTIQTLIYWFVLPKLEGSKRIYAFLGYPILLLTLSLSYLSLGNNQEALLQSSVLLINIILFYGYLQVSIWTVLRIFLKAATILPKT